MSATESGPKVGDYVILVPSEGTLNTYWGACGRVTDDKSIGEWTCCDRTILVEGYPSHFYFTKEQAVKVITKEQAHDPNFAAWIKASYNGN